MKPVADPSSLGAGKFIAYQNHHFVAVRCFEGQWQVNFGNKTHEWETAFWKDGGSAAYTKSKGGWHINAAQLESMFEIVAIDSVVDVANCYEADVAGGRGGDERTPAEWCKSFSLLDGQLCDHSDTCVATDRIGGCESATSALCRQYFLRSPIQQEDFPRVWHQLRDVAGGSTVSCVHACTGEEICRVSLLEDAAMILLRQEIAHHVQHLPFAIVLLAEESVIPRECTWAAIGRPPVLRVVLKPVTRESSRALTHAIMDQNHQQVIELLETGQDPNSWSVVPRTGRFEPALLTAAGGGFFYSLHLLLHAFADPNIAGPDKRTAMHLAAL